MANEETEETEKTQTEMPTPQHFLDLAIQSATEREMPVSELVGLLFYYTHSVCTTYRDDVKGRDETIKKLPEAGADQA